jgi:transcriptional regulator with XRE-family HTH domain
MTGKTLKAARTRAEWTQVRLARALGVTQAHLSCMESGRRRVPDRVARKVVGLFRLPLTQLPLSPHEKTTTSEAVARQLARLGYEEFAYLRKPGRMQNPASLLLAALKMSDLDSRVVEALPWLLLKFEGFDSRVLSDSAKAGNLQNRLGFTVALALDVARSRPEFAHRESELRLLESTLDSVRLAREDTFGRRDKSDAMREWVRKNRSEAARHWNVLSDLEPGHLPYGQ